MALRGFGKSVHNGELHTPCCSLPFTMQQRQATLYSMFLLFKKCLAVGVALRLFCFLLCTNGNDKGTEQNRSRLFRRLLGLHSLFCGCRMWFAGAEEDQTAKQKIRSLGLVLRAAMTTGRLMSSGVDRQVVMPSPFWNCAFSVSWEAGVELSALNADYTAGKDVCKKSALKTTTTTAATRWLFTIVSSG